MKNKEILKKFLLIIPILITLLIIGLILFNPNPTKKYFLPGNTENSLWYWDSINNVVWNSIDNKFKILKNENINNIYLSINDYIDIDELKDNNIKEEKKSEYKENIKKFITIANNNGITVEALAGDKTWSEDSHRYITKIIDNFVFEYNDSNFNQKFMGLQYDIEPYNLNEFNKNKDAILVNYISTVDGITKEFLSKKNNIRLGFTSPFWFDGQNNNIEDFIWNNSSKSAFEHLYDVLQNYDNSYIAIMDYRNYTEGIDGSIDNIKGEFNYSHQNNDKVKFIIGQETTDVQPQKITFFKKNKQDLNHAIDEVYNYYKDSKTLMGFSINDFESYTKMTEN